MTDVEKLCRCCMREMNPPQRYCPICGYDNEQKEKRDSKALPEHTILKGRYLLGRILGVGGFGITYLALDLQKEKAVAVKEYFPVGLVSRNYLNMGKKGDTVLVMPGEAGVHYREGLRKFAGEGQTLAQFKELPGIVTARDFFFENDTAYLVMDYIEGQSLKEYMHWYQQNSKNGEPMDYRVAVTLLMPIMKSLALIHQKGIIHRDISPDNILVDKEGKVTLIDFGAARTSILDHEYRSVTIMVKRGYAPEEQYRTHGKQGPWTDIYALCATLYHMISGRLPEESIERLVQDDVVPLKKMNLPVKVPVSVSDILGKGMAVRAADRYQAMEELYDALTQAEKEQKQLEIKRRAERLAAQRRKEEEKAALQKAEEEKLQKERRREREKIERAKSRDTEKVSVSEQKDKKAENKKQRYDEKRRSERTGWRKSSGIRQKHGILISICVLMTFSILISLFILIHIEDIFFPDNRTTSGSYFLPDSQEEKLNQGLWDSADVEEWNQFLKEQEVDVDGIDADDIMGNNSYNTYNYTTQIEEYSQFYDQFRLPEEKAPYWSGEEMFFLSPDGTMEEMDDSLRTSNRIIYSRYSMSLQKTEENLQQIGFTSAYLLESEGAAEIAFSSDTESGLIPFRYMNKIGYLNLEGEIAIPPKFEAAGKFSYGRALIWLDTNKVTGYGFIDETGELITPLFKEAADYGNGMARVVFESDGAQYAGYLDLEGNLKYVLAQDKIITGGNGIKEIGIGEMGIPSTDGSVCIGYNQQDWQDGSGKASGRYLLLDSEGRLLEEYSSDYRISSFLPCGLALVQDVSEINSLLRNTDSKNEYRKAFGDLENECSTKLWYINSAGEPVGDTAISTALEAEAFLLEMYNKGSMYELNNTNFFPPAEAISAFTGEVELPKLLSGEETSEINQKLWERTDLEKLEEQLYKNSMDIGETLYGIDLPYESNEDREDMGNPNQKVPFMEDGQEAYLYPDGSITEAADGFTYMQEYEKYGWYALPWYTENGGQNRIYFKDNSLTGVSDEQETLYLMDDKIENGLARIGISGKTGYVNQEGKVQIPLAFDSAAPFSEERAAVGIEDQESYSYTFIDTEGHIAAPLFDSVSDFKNGYGGVSFRIDGELYKGFIDTEGNLKYVFEDVAPTDDLSFITPEGTICIGGTYSYWDEDAEAWQGILGRYCLFDTEGNVLREFDSNYRISSFMPCGLALVQDVSPANELWKNTETIEEYCGFVGDLVVTSLWYMDAWGNQVGSTMEMTMAEAEEFLQDAGIGEWVYDISQADDYVEQTTEDENQGTDRSGSTAPDQTEAANEESTEQGKATFQEASAEQQRFSGENLVIGDHYIAAIRSEGSIAISGSWKASGFDDFSSWKNIKKLANSDNLMAGLLEDGTVVCSSSWLDEISAWTDITDLTVGNNFVAGLTKDGSLLIANEEYYDDKLFPENAFSDWTEILDIEADDDLLAGITKDHTVKFISSDGNLDNVVSGWRDIVAVDIRGDMIAGLRKDGTVEIATEDWDSMSEYPVDGWEDMIQITVGENHIAGLTSDGRVLCSGQNQYGECDTEEWQDVVEIAAGDGCTAAIRKDGTFLFTGKSINTGGDVESWEDIVDISAASVYSVGLKSDGTVVYTGNAESVEPELAGWENIQSVESGYYVSAGLREDGTVAVAGNSVQEDVLGWEDIVSVSIYNEIMGVKSDGTVVDTGLDEEMSPASWTDIVKTAGTSSHIVGLKSDGTVVALGDNEDGECDVSGWEGIVDIVAAYSYTAGVRSNGSIILTGDFRGGPFSIDKFTGISKLYGSDDYLIGLKADGTLAVAGKQYSNGIDLSAVEGWTEITDVAICDDHFNQWILGLKKDGTVVAEGLGNSSSDAVREWKDLRARNAS